MGVSGSGKTTVGKPLAKALGFPFYDADDFHPQENIEKMKQGIPLQDLDREPWLENLTNNLTQWEAGVGAVLACSALKETHRTFLQSGVANDISWVCLSGPPELIKERLIERKGHPFKPGGVNLQLWIESQFVNLELPKYGWHFNISAPVGHIVQGILDKLEHMN